MYIQGAGLRDMVSSPMPRFSRTLMIAKSFDAEGQGDLEHNQSRNELK